MNNNKIAVGILNKNEVDFNLNGNFSINNNTELTGKTKAFIKDDQLHLQNKNNILNVGEMVTFTPNNHNCIFEIKDVTIGVNFHWQQEENQQFKGDLKLLLTNKSIQVINNIDVEDYLLSVISSEMSSNCSLEFLKAHAIISRSWVMAQIHNQNNKTQPTNTILATDNEYIRWYDKENHSLFDVCADDHCQRYQGISRINNKNVAEAVKSTTGLVLMHNNTICDARFSKCCGGVSEVFENCWENTPLPYLPSICDSKEKHQNTQDLKNEKEAHLFINSNPKAFCNTTDKKIISQVMNNYDTETQNFFRWRVSYSQKEISDIIKEKSGFDFGDILDLTPIERGLSGRLVKLKITGSKKTLTIGKELEIRRWLSMSHLYSSAFTIEKHNVINNVPQQFILNGAGWGHGVGLCQIGAAAMGEQGYSFTDILQHYFKDVDIVKYR